MLDINYIRQFSDLVRKNLEKRQDKEKLKLFDKLLKLDDKWRKLKQETDDLRARRNKISQEINKAKKIGKSAVKFVKEAKELPLKLEKQEKKTNNIKEEMTKILLAIPNLLAEDVPCGESDEDNKEVKKFGKKKEFNFKILDHVELMKKWDLADLERAAKISGARFYFLKGKLAKLEMALLNYAADFLMKRKYTLIVPPQMINKQAYQGVLSMEDFEQDIYKIENEDLYCIATSEHPLVSQYMDDVFNENELPIKIAGNSLCFRKEAGTHGKEDKGIFRVHQFSKIEQVAICIPEESWALHEELLKNMTEFFETLGMHFRIINLCTGDISQVSAKTYDLEVWMPAQKKYRELGSCSNCLSYQATRLNIKFIRDNKRLFVHTLNSTCVASERALAAILENFQDEKGVIQIPKILHQYCGFKTIGGKQ